VTAASLAGFLRGFAGALLLLCLSMTASADSTSIGKAIYRDGILPSGEPLVAVRDAGLRMTGASVACVNCHRRSGLGMEEGRQTIPPVAGSYLFQPRARTTEELNVPFVPGMKSDREPYTDATLARAIREGIGHAGQQFNDLMPRYPLDDAAMRELIAYLKQLSPQDMPGVTESVLHFATIVTPDADPVKRQGVLDVLEKFFAEKNHYTRAGSPKVRTTYRKGFKVNRNWELHVWELSGAPDTWEEQLEKKLASEPVLAVISGVGGTTWAPVHHFCEEASLPCLFPNVDLPVVAEDDFDVLYFSRGVLLEADLIAHEIKARHTAPDDQRIVQIYRSGDVGEEAADALAAALPGDGYSVRKLRLDSGRASHELKELLRKTRSGDTLVLWLRADDIAALPEPPAGVETVFMSGRMSGLEAAPLPAAWRNVTHLAYPVDDPNLRRVRINFPLGWFRIRQIPVVSLEAQVDTYLACGIVSDTINHMVDAFVRDYLVERIEEMLAHRVMTGFYPRLALAPGQRFASKGGYVMHFAGPTGSGVVADGGWIVP
jgi:hypothetical protein